MCAVELPFKLYCTVNVCTKFTASIKAKYLLVVNKTISISIGIPENLEDLPGGKNHGKKHVFSTLEETGKP